MPEVTYWICDCCGVEDHWPTFPDGTPVEKGKGVSCTATWYGMFVRKGGGEIRWVVRMLYAGGRGDDEARRHGRDKIYLCAECRGVADEAAGTAALEALRARGLKTREGWITERVEGTFEGLILHAIDHGVFSPRALEENPPLPMTGRDVRVVVQDLIDRGEVLLDERLKLKTVGR